MVDNQLFNNFVMNMKKNYNQYTNLSKVISLSELAWDKLLAANLAGIPVKHTGGNILNTEGHNFINMCSCSYLGLDIDKRILEGAKKAIDVAGTLHLTTARVRIYIDLLKQVEAELSQHFACEAMIFNSCAAATSAFLPLLAAGAFTNDSKPLMVFDKHCHFSMKHIIPICGDETDVVIAPHNDTEFLENCCRENSNVAYIGDGTYSMGGQAPIQKLLDLQDRYNLFIYLDDSHGLSITHPLGWGYARGNLPTINNRTVVVASLAKAFGACGGVLMCENTVMKDRLLRYGNAWSQYLNSAGIGAIKSSLDIHKSSDLVELQKRLWQNVSLFDEMIAPQNANTSSPVRLITLSSAEDAIQVAENIFRKGFYTSPVFFPIVPRGTAGLRVMPRADLTKIDIVNFCNILRGEGVLDDVQDL